MRFASQHDGWFNLTLKSGKVKQQQDSFFMCGISESFFWFCFVFNMVSAIPNSFRNQLIFCVQEGLLL